MTQYGWVIDQTRCIGCHACTTACKSENEVALGVFRTWVKAVEVGRFPQVRRHFAVLRCNHCANPPCVAICPVTAMYQRADGLVDFDAETCIGCKACMQACPYDAIYMDPETDTAAKCNFCSHRVDEGLLPACVVVCPEEALLFGDLEDPTSAVARRLGSVPVTVRRPEQGTRPKAFYVGGHEAALEPLAARHDGMYAWADVTAGGGTTGGWRDGKGLFDPPIPPSDYPPPLPARVAYDIPRQRTWSWRVSSYIWTKSIAAGAGLLAAADRIRGIDAGGAVGAWTLPVVAALFLLLTGALLVADLKRPERFWTILFRPQWRSWLARGAFIITAYAATLGAWLACLWLGLDRPLDALAWLLGILALATAAYTAALFAQAEGRDLWQSPLLGVELVLEALLSGLAVIAVISPRPPASLGGEAAVLAAGLIVAWLLDALGPHATTNARAAARALGRGAQAGLFWTAAAAMLLSVALAAAGDTALPAAGIVVLAALWLHAHAFILAGQGPPIS